MAKTKKYQIISARVEQASGGPDAAILVAEVELKPANGAPFFYTLVECEGMPMVHKTESSVFDWWMEPDAYESELDELQDAGSVYEGENYDELFKDHKSIECYEGLRYLIYVMRTSWDEAEAYIQATKGKNLDEIEIPSSDAEVEWENTSNPTPNQVKYATVERFVDYAEELVGCGDYKNLEEFLADARKQWAEYVEYEEGKLTDEIVAAATTQLEHYFKKENV